MRAPSVLPLARGQAENRQEKKKEGACVRLSE